jgi:hypothetical protein
MDLWQKLTVDWPCTLGDWLWANIAVPLSTLPRQFTLRRVVYLAALLVAAAALAQIFTADIAITMAGDIAFYCEIASVVMFIVVRGHIRQVVHVVRLALNRAVRRGTLWCRQRVGTRRHRSGRKPTAGDARSDDDGAAGWIAGLKPLYQY